MLRELFGLFLIFLGLLFFLSLATHNLNDPHFNYSNTNPIQNSAGMFGAYLSAFLANMFGLSSYAFPLLFIAFGAGISSSYFVLKWYRWLGLFVLFICAITFFEAFGIGVKDIQGGGILGAFLYAKMHEILSPAGSGLLWFFGFVFALQFAFNLSVFNLAKDLLIKLFNKLSKKVKEQNPSELIKKVAKKPTEKKALPEIIETTFTEKPKSSTKSLSFLDVVETKPKLIKASPNSSFNLPSINLLEKAKNNDFKINKEELENKGKMLLACLADFNIQADLVKICPGPVVTMYELKPAPGVKVAKISGLVDDITRSLKAVSIRIQAPIAGEDTVGVEIPNDVRSAVNFRELLENQDFSEANSLLTLALGKDISGKVRIADLAKMPHLLVAGATGAGKSVFLNSVIISFLYKAKPDELKLLLIDPKRVEMANFADLPHLVHPVVTDMLLAKNALTWAIFEMERRYSLLADLGVKNITDYNHKLEQNPKTENHHKLPYIVIIIDELADLMLTVGKEVETLIIRLAQLARAAGIHLIIATQRPSVDVVTGLIKANFPCRISFQVTSKHDSRTILDTIGAEYLLGKGDMLYKPSGTKQVRVHGAYVSDEEVIDVVDFWKKQAKPVYDIDFKTWTNEAVKDAISPKLSSELQDDPIYVEAVQFVRSEKKVSISQLQRRFRIGFNRAAGFVEQMEKDGIVNKSLDGKPRTVN